MSDLTKYRSAFTDYLTSLKLSVPDHAKNIDDLTFCVFWTKHVLPYRDNLDEGYEKLREWIIDNGHEIPALKDEEKAKIKRFISAICDIIDPCE